MNWYRSTGRLSKTVGIIGHSLSNGQFALVTEALGTFRWIAYGAQSISPTILSEFRQGEMARNLPGAPVAAGINGRMLRIRDVEPALAQRPPPRDLRHADSQFARYESFVLSCCGPWAVELRSFVSAYLGETCREVNTRQVQLLSRAADLAGLVEPMHWAFSAAAPLPRAHVLLPSLALAHDQSAWLPVDLLFWTKQGLVACYLASQAALGSRRRAMDRIAASGATVVELAHASDIPALIGRFGLHATIGDDFLPGSPFQAVAIARPTSLRRSN